MSVEEQKKTCVVLSADGVRLDGKQCLTGLAIKMEDLNKDTYLEVLAIGLAAIWKKESYKLGKFTQDMTLAKWKEQFISYTEKAFEEDASIAMDTAPKNDFYIGKF